MWCSLYSFIRKPAAKPCLSILCFKMMLSFVLMWTVATSPSCDVDRSHASAGESVTYTCSVTATCGNISVPLAIAKDGDSQSSKENFVQWTVSADTIANANVTCLTAQCPEVNVTGKCSYILTDFAHILLSSLKLSKQAFQDSQAPSSRQWNIKQWIKART